VDVASTRPAKNDRGEEDSVATVDHWSREEVEAIVADYLHMLTQELAGQTYNKAAHRRNLQQRLRGRSDGSIEMKHQNISAAMLELGCPSIVGYKPLPNFQSLLFDVVEERVLGDPLFDRAALTAAEQPAVAPVASDFAYAIDTPPELRPGAAEPKTGTYVARPPRTVRDYLAREARNASLGRAGEEFVVAYERYRLASIGKEKLGNRVEHVASTKGDGLGYDVLSFDPSGRERFIEVKTTSFGKETPFFITRNEVAFSETFPEQFYLYRVFQFRKNPRLFSLEGNVRSRVQLDPVSYVAKFS